MRRHGLSDVKRISLPHATTLGDTPQITLGAVAFSAADREIPSPFKHELCARTVNGKPERAERTLAPPAWIEKPKVQARSCSDGRSLRPRRSFICTS
jgi:hypothetical protein